MRDAKVTVALADDHVIVREGLRALLESDPRFVVVGEAATGIEAFELVKRKKPKVLIVDLMMPGMDGMETTRIVSRMKFGTRVIILTMYEDEAYILSALRYGAAGYVVKESCGVDLFHAIRDVVAGRFYLSPLLPEDILGRYLRIFRTALMKLSDTLTNRERQVLQLVFEGASSRDISSRLKISLRTVKSDLVKFVGRLGTDAGRAAVRHAVRDGI